jgi:hypothetical protein
MKRERIGKINEWLDRPQFLLTGAAGFHPRTA